MLSVRAQAGRPLTVPIGCTKAGWLPGGRLALAIQCGFSLPRRARPGTTGLLVKATASTRRFVPCSSLAPGDAPSFELHSLVDQATSQRTELALSKDVFGPEAPATVQIMTALVATLVRMGQFAEATAINRDALDIGQRIYGPDIQRRWL
ncbi:hypothetical protein WJX72_010996 [[Myrmecia] bisecta]|uniref:Uncharacterized protein n=1 Tax=[Myrmecia] bisecta TaxID=41462 RepID=A0AAW1QSQ6_9CHLO